MLKIENLSKTFDKPLSLPQKIANLLGEKHQAQSVKAVQNITLHVKPNTVLGLVGESGSGKSTLGRMIAGIYAPTSGKIIYNEELSAKAPAIQMIFQDASAALNPKRKAIDLVTEAPLYHGLITKDEQHAFALDLFKKVGLNDTHLHRFSHQFSGGQRARLGIARALAVKPKVLIADEAVASLDVSIQAQILNLLQDLQQEMSLTTLFISHDLSVIGHICDEVAVMYLGKIVEIGTRDEIFNNAKHPYTQSLLAEIPEITGKKRAFTPILGEIPSPLNPPKGCAFHPRCPLALDKCKMETPELKGINHAVSCHLSL